MSARIITSVIMVEDAIEITWVEESDLRNRSGIRRMLTIDPDLLDEDLLERVVGTHAALLTASLSAHAADEGIGAPADTSTLTDDGLSAWERLEREG